MNKFISKLQRILDLYQGIGYGTSTIRRELNSFYKYIPNGKVFVDVGGNKGLYTLAINDIFSPNEIHIFEPSKTNIKILEQTFKKYENIYVNAFGLSNENKSAILYSNESGSGLGSLSKRRLDHFKIDFSLQEEVKLMKFKDYWNQNISSDYIDLFKIDVEGHELDVLAGIGDQISDIKIIQFEFGGCNIDTKTYFQDYWYYFKNNNFDIFRITPFGNLEIKKYKEELERFQTTNYFCVNRKLL